MTDLRYPIGKVEDQVFSAKDGFSEEIRDAHLRDIMLLPQLLENAVQNLDEAQLRSPYRPGGWTVQQVVHHVADSHINAYVRFKLALTEDNPTIKPYNQDAWAALSDTEHLPINISLTLLHALHARWCDLIKNMSEADWQRTVYHPEQQRTITLWSMLAIYAWHGKHHTAHVINAGLHGK